MSHTRIYIDSALDNEYLNPCAKGGIINVTDAETIHKVKDVLRLGAEKTVYVFDGKGNEFLCKINETKRNSLRLAKINIARQETPKTPIITLGFPLVREDRIDFILQKATELGVNEFMPFICERSLRYAPSESKMTRWQKVLIEATRQSERLWIPKLHPTSALGNLIRQSYEVKLAAGINGEDTRSVLPALCKEIFIVVGPEGDFSDPEYVQLKENNFKIINLSPHILRVETAAIFAVGLLRMLPRKITNKNQ